MNVAEKAVAVVAGLIRVGIAVGILVGGVFVFLFFMENFNRTGGFDGPWGIGLIVAVGLSFVVALFGAIGFAVAWGFRRGWAFMPPKD